MAGVTDDEEIVQAPNAPDAPDAQANLKKL